MGYGVVKYGILGVGVVSLGYMAWQFGMEFQKRRAKPAIIPSRPEANGQVSDQMQPLYSRVDFEWDGMLMYEENDREQAIQFKRHLEQAVHFQDLKIKICLYPDEEPAGKPELQDFNDVFERFRYVFVFETKSFENNYKQRFKNEMVMIDSLDYEMKRKRVIPVCSEIERPRILELKVLHGIPYHRYNSENPDQFYISSIRTLIEKGRTDIVKFALPK